MWDAGTACGTYALLGAAGKTAVATVLVAVLIAFTGGASLVPAGLTCNYNTRARLLCLESNVKKKKK